MTKERPIYTETQAGELIAMRLSAPPNEDALQELIASYPEIVSEEDGELLLIRREQGVPDEDAGADRWSLDHLFVTKSAVPVLMEVKRASDTRLRREVIGQLLDYAANGVAYWPTGALETNFKATCETTGIDPDRRMSVFLEKDDVSGFWEQVDSNLAAGRLRLVVAADVIPPELARVIEFLNEQMKADVKAIELRYYESAGGQRTLVPRIIGETERSKSLKSRGQTAKPDPLTLEQWMDQYIAPKDHDTLTGVNNHFEIVRKLGGDVVVAKTQASVYVRFDDTDGPKVLPIRLWKDGNISISFSAKLDDSECERLLQHFRKAVGELTTSNIRGYPAFPASRLVDPKKADAYEQALSHYVELARTK